MLRNAIKQSKTQCWKALCADVDRDPWGTPYRLMVRKLQASRGTVAPREVPTVFKIVEALFPDGASRESYPSDLAPTHIARNIAEMFLQGFMKGLQPCRNISQKDCRNVFISASFFVQQYFMKYL